MDNVLHRRGELAARKLALLPRVLPTLRRKELHLAIVDRDGLAVLRQWLEPLEGGILPHARIRTAILKVLLDFPKLHKEYDLKRSKIGQAVNTLYNHPKENARNKDVCLTLIRRWMRDIKGLSARFAPRRQGTVDVAALARVRAVREAEAEQPSAQVVTDPTDQGFCWRARVPQALQREFVVQPRSDAAAVAASKRDVRTGGAVATLMRQQRRHLSEARKRSDRNNQHSWSISIEGKRTEY